MNNAPSTTAPPSAPDAANNRGHEPDAVNPRLVIVSAVGLVLLVALVLLLMHETFGVLAYKKQVADGQRPRVDSGETSAGPEFTPDQSRQLRELRQNETHRLSTYEWTDEAAGEARIPIDRAIELLAERGLNASPPEDGRPHDNRSE